uniref:Uncharacterized protein LOC111131808 n=1 Tax=Crassostrea virginica TaxID=6565 RepID=A0A8B8E3U5_CRAVI|nr:uncharacterized protein LOC111131808 [Crassostrea virginica]
MGRTILFLCIFSVLLKHAESACSAERITGPNCVRDGIVIPPGGTYEKTTGPGCFECTCRRDNGGLILTCCDVGRIAVSYPKDICRVVQRGCDLLAVSKKSDYKPCRGPVGYVAG